MDRVRRNPAGVGAARFQGGEFSPRVKIVIFFTYFILTFGIVKAWMIIIEENNVFYETAAAFATMILLASIYWYYYRILMRHRQRMELLRNHDSPSAPLDDADIEAAQRRLRLHRLFGENVDFFMHGGPGLSEEIIHNILIQYTYETDKIDDKDCMKGEEKVIDLECGESDAFHKCECPEVDAKTECAVCLTDFVDGDLLIELTCSHRYHRDCITSWLMTRNLCPMCKQLAVQPSHLEAALAQQQQQQQQATTHSEGADVAPPSSAAAAGDEPSGPAPSATSRARRQMPMRSFSYTATATAALSNLFGRNNPHDTSSTINIASIAPAPAEALSTQSELSPVRPFSQSSAPAETRTTAQAPRSPNRVMLGVGTRALSVNDISDLQSVEDEEVNERS